MSDANGYIRQDDQGALRVGDTRVMLDGIVASFREGTSPECILQQYPSLTLEQVYGAITYYLAHEKEVHTYLQQQDKFWEKLRAESGQDSLTVVRRLRGIRDGATLPR